MGKLARVPCLKFLHLGGVTIGDGVFYTNHEHTSCLSLRHHKPAGTIAGMVPITGVLCQQSKLDGAYTCPGQCLLIPAGLELEQLGVLPAGGYQLRVGALLDHAALVQHEDAIG